MFLNYFLVSASIGVIALISKKRFFNFLLLIAFLAVNVAMLFFVFNHTGEHFLKYFYIDTLSALFFSVLVLIVFFNFFHSYKYLKRNPAAEINRESRYWASLMLFITAMAGVYFSDNLAILWAFVEATTLLISILLLYKKSSFSLEAAWKYLFVASIGLTFAFIGILILSGLTGGDLNVSEIIMKAGTLNAVWLKIVFLLVLIGFSVKMESFPFYPVCIDALGVAPRPVAALMTTALMNAGLIGVLRMFQIILPSSSADWARNVFLIMGVLSLIIATYKMYRVSFLERLLAFSSLEHVGIILIAFSLGKAGIFVAILHIVLHSLIKSSLFFQVDQISYIYHTHQLRKIGNYFKYNSWGAIIFLLSFLGIAAIPPSGLFISEFLLVKAFITENHFVLGGFVLLFLTIIIYFMAKNIMHLLFTSEDEYPVEEKVKISVLENASPVLLLIIMAYLAFFQPDFFIGFIQKIVTIF